MTWLALVRPYFINTDFCILGKNPSSFCWFQGCEKNYIVRVFTAKIMIHNNTCLLELTYHTDSHLVALKWKAKISHNCLLHFRGDLNLIKKKCCWKPICDSNRYPFIKQNMLLLHGKAKCYREPVTIRLLFKTMLLKHEPYSCWLNMSPLCFKSCHKQFIKTNQTSIMQGGCQL